MYIETHLLSCGVNLINDGIVIKGNTVTVEFAGISAGNNGDGEKLFSCHLQGRPKKCK